MTTPGNDPYSTPTPGPGVPPPPAAPYGAPTGPPYPPQAAPGGYGQAPGGYGQAPGGYGQPQYGPPAWQRPAPTLRRTLGARLLTFTGLVLSLAGVALLVVGIGRLADSFPGDIRDWVTSVAAVDTPGTTEVALTGGSTYELWTTRIDAAFADAGDVVVTGPSGEQVPVRSVAGDVSSTDLNASILGRLTVPETGTYTFTVTESLGVLTLMPDGTFDEIVTGFMTGTGLVLGSFVVGGIGFCLLLAGGIWWGVAASNNRKVRALGTGGTPPPGAVVHPGL